MLKKRFLSLIIAFVMVLSIDGSAAFASDISAEDSFNIPINVISGFEDEAGNIGRFVFPEDKRPSLAEVTEGMPRELSVYLEGKQEAVKIPVSWECVGSDYELGEFYYYQFSPVFEGDTILTDVVDVISDAPYISVEFLFEDDYEAYLAEQDEVLALGAVSSQAANEKAVFEYLTGTMKLNKGAACGIMANIYAESTFRPTASHTEANGSVSYGICQWNGSRKTRLEDYCDKNGYDYQSINGQLHYLEYELEKYYKTNVYTPIAAVENTAEGAYEAAYIWCVKFEIPANKETVGKTRGNTARDKFWPEYKNVTGGESPTNPVQPDKTITLTSKNITAKAIPSKEYNGLPYTPIPTLSLALNGKNVKLLCGKDFTVSYDNNVEPGIATVKICGNGKYDGELSFDYVIQKRNLKKATIFADDLMLKSGDAPRSYVYYGKDILVEGVDYTLVKEDNLTEYPTKRKVVVKAVDSNECRYTGTKDATINIVQGSKMLSEDDVTFLDETSFIYTGKQIKPSVAVSYNGSILDAKNYSVAYKNNINAGTGLVVVTGKKEFKGRLYIPFEILPRSGELALGVGIKEQKYKGTYIKPKPQVLYAGKKLTENKDYYLAYSNNLGPSEEFGNAEVLIKGIGNYSNVEPLSAGFVIVK